MALTDNIISYWKLDESSGNAADSVGSNTLTNTGTTFTIGKINNGASFDTNGDTLSTTSGLGLSSTGAFSYSFWFNTNGNAFGSGDLVRLIPGTANVNWSFRILNSTTLQFDHERPCITDDNLNATVSALDTSTWYFIVCTFDGTTQRLYFNGTDVANTNPSGTGSCSNSTGFYLSSNYKGLLDEVGIWSRALSSTEVTTLYNSGAGLQYPFVTTNIKNINGLAKASVKTVNGLAIASVKTVNGLA